tara:strand:+ start:40 stop:582 length:543 start_codon:yes stop_codon:yes gene_type:complete
MQWLIEQLKQRIPEMEWKINQLPPNKHLWRLPRGIFRLKAGSPYAFYITEIKEDIELLEAQTCPKRQWYLAKQIETKITLLIRISTLQNKNNTPSGNQNTIVQRLSTRKQWMEELEQRIDQITRQIVAMEQQLSKYTEQKKHLQTRLQLEHDIGEAHRQRTLLKEQYQRASSDKSRDSRP